MDAMAHFGGGIGNVLRVQAFVDGLPGFAAIVGSKRARGRDGDDHALRIAGIVKDAMQTHATSAWLPLRSRAVVPLVRGEGLAGFRGSVVDEFVAFGLGRSSRPRGGFARGCSRLDPSFATVIGALDNLP